MDIEQLKLVLETIKGITDDAASVAIWYFVLYYGLSFLSNVIFAGTIFGVVYLVATAFKSAHDDESLVKELRAEFCEYPSGWVSDSERIKIRQGVAAWKAKVNGNT